MKVQEKYLDSNKSLVKECLKSEENILKILSPMGTGKTNIIRSFLEEENLRILCITNRVSLGLEFKEIGRFFTSRLLYLYSKLSIFENSKIIFIFILLNTRLN